MNNNIKINKKALNTYNNKDYRFFIVDVYDKPLTILSGWEYKEDARDDLNELQESYENVSYNVDLKIITRTTLDRFIK